jgi:hypothetical protein
LLEKPSQRADSDSSLEKSSALSMNRSWNVLTALRFPKALVPKIGCYDKGDRAYPHRNVPVGDNHLPFEDEAQGVSDRDDEKNCTRQQGKRILAQLPSPPAENESKSCGRIVLPWSSEVIVRLV